MAAEKDSPGDEFPHFCGCEFEAVPVISRLRRKWRSESPAPAKRQVAAKHMEARRGECLCYRNEQWRLAVAARAVSEDEAIGRTRRNVQETRLSSPHENFRFTHSRRSQTRISASPQGALPPGIQPGYHEMKPRARPKLRYFATVVPLS